MDQTTEELRAAIIRSRAGQVRWRCPEDLKQEIVRHTEAQRAKGVAVYAIAKGLGVSESGLARWLQPRTGRIKPVRVVEEVDAVEGELTLVTPGGYRLEGLTSIAAAEVLRRLGC